LLRVFDLSEAQRRALWRQKFAPENPNVYRGWFPVQPGNLTAKEGIDLGGDIAHGSEVLTAGDPLREATPLPDPTYLPGWSDSCAAYYLAMEGVCGMLMHSLARSLHLAQDYFDLSFRHGLSTLRLLRYPVRATDELETCGDAGVWVCHHGRRRHVTGAPHTDSGFITVLAQDGIEGLQARLHDGAWIDVPPEDDMLVVNFGQILEQWCGGRIKATEHRVLGADRERRSVPFFYEARADALISPLPGNLDAGFRPFLFGDYLWDRITQFVEFRGMESLRQHAPP
jgi:isopenicillin N synthase-like dioxygenase